MIIIQAELPRNHELVLFGDNQRGNVLSHEEGYQECIEYVLTKPSRFACHMGDAIESIWIDDPRYQLDAIKHTPLEAIEAEIKALEPLIKRQQLLTMLFGNHEFSLLKRCGNITEHICQRLRNSNTFPVYGTYSCRLEIYDPDSNLQYKTYLTHGRKFIGSIADDPIRRHSNMLLQLKNHLKRKAGDCLIMGKGHSHRLLISEPVPELYLTSHKCKIKQNYSKPDSRADYIPDSNRWYLCSGSFLKHQGIGFSSYSEMFEMDPVELGYIVIHVKNGQVERVQKKII